MIYDVRKSNEEIDKIIFANDNMYFAYSIIEGDISNAISILDGCGEFVVISGAKHARDLIKALNKAIELGWLHD